MFGVGCSAPLDPALIDATNAGRYGGAREAIQATLTEDKSDRDYLLNRLRLLVLTLADGQPAAAEETANQTFALLRTQGLNADRTVASVVVSESVKIWKGEPFEQAMAYHYVALQKAMLNEWDNARAASQSSLFLLKDFRDNEQAGKNKQAATVAPQTDSQVADNGYVAVKTDFALGYIMTGLAARALGRAEEASDNFNEAARVNPRLKDLCDQLRTGTYNTVLIVDSGRGPQKVVDGDRMRFLSSDSSDGGVLSLTPPSGVPGAGANVAGVSVPAVHNVDAMAQSHLWNNLAQARAIKSTIGDAMIIGGTVVAANDNNKENQRWAGAAAVIAGLLLKASSQADTRFNEFFPQNVYVVPMNVTEVDSAVRVSAGQRGMTLNAIDPPPQGQSLQLRYVRLNPGRDAGWTGNGVLYANDAYGQPVPGGDLPYVFGGRCVRLPTARVVDEYHRAGNLINLTYVDLENLYREEGFTFTVEDQAGRSRKHVLEGGGSLVCPLAGTAGYQRLFGNEHPPYMPRSAALQRAIEEERNRKQGLDRPAGP